MNNSLTFSKYLYRNYLKRVGLVDMSATVFSDAKMKNVTAQNICKEIYYKFPYKWQRLFKEWCMDLGLNLTDIARNHGMTCKQVSTILSKCIRRLKCPAFIFAVHEVEPPTCDEFDKVFDSRVYSALKRSNITNNIALCQYLSIVGYDGLACIPGIGKLGIVAIAHHMIVNGWEYYYLMGEDESDWDIK